MFTPETKQHLHTLERKRWESLQMSRRGKCTFWPKEGGVARLVTVRRPVMLRTPRRPNTFRLTHVCILYVSFHIVSVGFHLPQRGLQDSASCCSARTSDRTCASPSPETTPSPLGRPEIQRWSQRVVQLECQTCCNASVSSETLGQKDEEKVTNTRLSVCLPRISNQTSTLIHHDALVLVRCDSESP